MKKQHIFLFYLLLFCFIVPCTARAKTVRNTSAFDFYFRDVGNNTCCITEIRINADKGISELKIPSTINGKTVVSIGPKYFSSDHNYGIAQKNVFGLFQMDDSDRSVSEYWDWMPKDDAQKRRAMRVKKIILPDTIKVLKKDCFAAMKGLKSVKLPKKLTRIESGAFACTAIKKIHLSNSLTSIGQTAFLNTPLKEINIPANLKDEVTGLVRVKWNNSKRGDGFWKRFTISKKNPYYKIKNGMLFSKDGKILYGVIKKRKNIRIPDAVTTLYSSTFHKVPLKTLYLGAGLNEIGVSALATNTLCHIKLHPKNPYLAKSGNCIYWKKNKAIVAGKPKNGVLKIPKKVRLIDKNGFSIIGRNKIKKLIIPKTVKDIKKGWRYATLEHYDIDKIKCKVITKKNST